ncbi:MAG: caspase family protein [Chloroflexaceae bacterium]
MVTASNVYFYTSGALPRDYPGYISRPADYAAWRALQQGKLIYTIAPRQVGKTSLLKRLAARLSDQGWCCCQVDLATFGNLERTHWFQRIGERIAQACHTTAAIAGLDGLVDQQAFRTFLLDTIGLRNPAAPARLALFFDEVEGLRGMEFSDDFLMTLRDLYQHREDYPGHLLISFAGAVDPQALIKDQSISPFNIAEEITLNDFTAAETQHLTGYLEQMNLPVEAAVHAQIYAWTGGHPYLTQRLCEIITTWADTRAISRITPEVVDRAVQTGLLAPRSRDKNIKHVESKLYELLSESPRPLDALAQKLWQRLRLGEPVYSTEPGFYALYLTGAVAEASDGQIQLRNRIYRVALGLDEIDGRGAESGGALPTSTPVLNPGRAWALLVGINCYDDAFIADLQVCVDDVTAVQQALAESYQVARLLTDATPTTPPTRANILSSLANIAQAAAEEDVLLFYFSGHGLAEGGESYLLPCDARLSALRHTAVVMQDLRDLLDQSPARARVVIIDACHSGAAIGKAPPTMTPEFIQRVFAEAEGMAVLASCKQGQRSWEWPDQGRSVFTYYLLEALRGQADNDRKGFVTVSDAGRYVADRVKHWSVEHSVLQTPTLQYTVAGDIVLCRVAQFEH